MMESDQLQKGRAVGKNDVYPLLQYPKCYGKVGQPCVFNGKTGEPKCLLRAGCMMRRREQRRKDSILRLPKIEE
jgi:hypothetical protein